MGAFHRVIGVIFSLVFVLLFSRCGGVVGHIKFYDFNVSKNKLEMAIRTVMQNHKELSIPKEDKYAFDYDSLSWFCYIKDANGEEVFSYSFYGDSTYWQKSSEFSRLALISMGERGDVISFKTTYFPTTKWRMIGKFERNFVDQVREQIENDK